MDQFAFKNVTLREVRSAFFKIKSQACGVDNISIKLLHPILNQILPVLTRIINGCISTSVFPALWKQAIIRPIPKTNKPVSIDDTRPISIISPLAKTCEHILDSQIALYIETHKLFTPFQSGFRRKHSTATALVDITDTIRHTIDNRKVCIMVLLDFSSAFNLVILIFCLQN
jgi:hypothetical protein